MQQEAEAWMYEFFSKLRASILDCRGKDADGNDLYSSEDIEKHFYSFLMERWAKHIEIVSRAIETG